MVFITFVIVLELFLILTLQNASALIALPNFNYDISFWQLAEGKESWLLALRYKNWFHKEMEKEFIEVFDLLKTKKYF